MPMFSKISLLLSTPDSLGTCSKVEISAVKICPIRCDYCPQDILIESTKRGTINQQRLTLQSFKLYIDNLKNTSVRQINWTGYSEACLNPELPDMVTYAYQCGFDQMISTTLVGYEHCINFISETDVFNSITLHLPDNNQLMEHGKLKVDSSYISRIDQFIASRYALLQASCRTRVSTLTFGEDYHHSIKRLLTSEKALTLFRNKRISKQLHSRGGTINSIANLISSQPGKQTLKRSLNKILSIPIGKYYCSYKRLRQPVILGDGNCNICCMDYSISGIIGNLSTHSLDVIYKNWDKENLSSFASGSYSVCKNCEYYSPITVVLIIKLLINRVKSLFK